MLRALLRRMTDGRVLDSASAAAFWLFFSLLPLVVVVLMVVAKVATADVRALGPIVVSFPASSRALVHQELGQLAAWRGGTVGPVSGAVFLWLASSGIHATLNAFDAAAGATRPWWRKRAIALGICVVLSLVVAAVSILLAIVDRGPAREVLRFLTVGAGRYATAFAGELGLIVTLFAAGLRDLPVRWPGALLAAGLHSLLGYGYVLYLQTLGGHRAYTAAGLAAVGATMIAVYLIVVSLLVGVVLNVTLGQRRSARSPRTPLHHRLQHA